MSLTYNIMMARDRSRTVMCIPGVKQLERNRCTLFGSEGPPAHPPFSVADQDLGLLFLPFPVPSESKRQPYEMRGTDEPGSIAIL